MKHDNLNRIRGILSARQGAQIPKFSNSGKLLYKQLNNGKFAYSNDSGATWYDDAQFTQAYSGRVNSKFWEAESMQFTEDDLSNTMNSNLPYVVYANKVQKKIEEQRAKQEAASAIANQATVASTNPNDGVATESNTETVSAGMKTAEEQAAAEAWKNQKHAKRNQTLGTIGQGLSKGIQIAGGAFGAAQAANDSDLTKGITAGWDATANIASQFGPVGKAIGSAMGIAKGAGDIMQAITGGTDQITKTDQWMSSPLLSWNIGAIHELFAKNTDSFGVDQNTLSTVGSSYGGSVSQINDAASKAGKKVGLLAGKERREINADIASARASQARMRGIADTANDQRLAVQSMGEQAGLAYSMMTDGGYNQKYTYAAKQGGVINQDIIEFDWTPSVTLNWELPTFKDGGSVEFVEKLDWVPEFKDGNKIRTLEELIEYAKQQNPRFIQRLSEEPRGIKFTDDEGNEVEGSHYLESRGEYVIPRIQEVNGELQFFNSQDALNKALETGNYLKLSPEEAIIFAEQYKQGWPDFFKKFKQGGSLGDSDIPEIEETTQKNVIPEGALHKNKHHMEHAEGLTKKGIPVVDEDGEQQAEIEHSEIIFTLEVTKKLEEYYEIFYSENTTNKEKEQAALDAGKLLVYQILENTEDRTGLIETCKQGGSLTLQKSTDNLI